MKEYIWDIEENPLSLNELEIAISKLSSHDSITMKGLKHYELQMIFEGIDLIYRLKGELSEIKSQLAIIKNVFMHMRHKEILEEVNATP